MPWPRAHMMLLAVVLTISGTLATVVPKQHRVEPLARDVTLVFGGDIYTLQDGSTDVVRGHSLMMMGTKISAILPDDRALQLADAMTLAGLRVEVVDATGLTVAPGLVDAHVHATGGGGEQGPYSRTPEARLSELLLAGLTTVVGILGTDSVGRSLEALLMKVKGLKQEGMSAYMWSGAYRVPVNTLTGDVQKDVMLVDEVLGLGEVALSDHRSSWPSHDELVRMLSDTRNSGLLSDKAGVVHFHVGNYESGLDPLFEIINYTDIPVSTMYPTHVSSRTQALRDQAKQFISPNVGGFIDLTADESVDDNATVDFLHDIRSDPQLSIESVSVSSDAYGSLPKFDDDGNLIGYGVGKPDTLLHTVHLLTTGPNAWPLGEALLLSSYNPARFLKFRDKGSLQKSMDADVMVFSQDPRDGIHVHYLFCKGETMKTPTWTKKGMFEL